MARIYYRLIIGGERSIESVPERWRAEVAAIISSEGSQ